MLLLQIRQWVWAIAGAKSFHDTKGLLCGLSSSLYVARKFNYLSFLFRIAWLGSGCLNVRTLYAIVFDIHNGSSKNTDERMTLVISSEKPTLQSIE